MLLNKISAIWITKGLFIFVVCIAEWNVCSNLGLMYYERINLKSDSNNYTFNGKVYDNGTVLVIGIHCGDNVNFEIGALTYPRVTPNLFYRISHGNVLPTDFTAIK